LNYKDRTDFSRNNCDEVQKRFSLIAFLTSASTQTAERACRMHVLPALRWTDRVDCVGRPAKEGRSFRQVGCLVIRTVRSAPQQAARPESVMGNRLLARQKLPSGSAEGSRSRLCRGHKVGRVCVWVGRSSPTRRGRFERDRSLALSNLASASNNGCSGFPLARSPPPHRGWVISSFWLEQGVCKQRLLGVPYREIGSPSDRAPALTPRWAVSPRPRLRDREGVGSSSRE
jgi:hypothetical protein